ncbi:MAG: diacylglycerol kinase family protein [Christensenella sp.]|nr:diacylglycerol kinase family protein [Christensenella sp.]
MKYILYNPLSNNGKGELALKQLQEIYKDEEVTEQSIINLDLKSFVSSLKEDDEIVITGGDGTIHCFINELDGVCPSNKVWYYASGSGNDFCKDIGKKKGDIILLNEYLVNLPYCIVNGIKKYFIDNIGYGIDGYVCEEADKIKKRSSKPINYTMIALKGLLFFFKRKKVKLIVDGVEHNFEQAWFAPTMHGRYFGGGMKVAPDQKRNTGMLSTIIFSCKSKLKTLFIFPEIFKGTHVFHTKNCFVFTGKDIEVTFNEPCALQIDGETYLNVTGYKAHID